QWVTLLYLGADFRIEQWLSRTLRSGEKTPAVGPVVIDGNSIGAEGFVVLNVPARAQRNQPDYSFLEQGSLGDGALRKSLEPPEDPFERLLHSVTAASGVRERAVAPEAPATPQIQSWTWVTVRKR